jgi:hypothetical protein
MSEIRFTIGSESVLLKQAASDALALGQSIMLVQNALVFPSPAEQSPDHPT